MRPCSAIPRPVSWSCGWNGWGTSAAATPTTRLWRGCKRQASSGLAHRKPAQGLRRRRAMSTDLAVVGTVVPRMGLADKVQGKTRYTADLKRPGMVYGRVLRSPHAHARIVHIDVSASMRLPGVHAVLTYRDVPAVRLEADLLPLDEIVRFVGDEVAVVAAESETLAEDALRLIRVEYEVLPAVFDAGEALRPDAPSVHAQGNLVGGKALVVERGSVTEALRRAARVFEGTFRTQIHAPVGMETRAALAEWQG